MQIKNSKLYIITFAIGFIILTVVGGALFFTIGTPENKSVSQENRYKKLVDLKIESNLQDSALTKMRRLGLKEGTSNTIEIRSILGEDFTKIYLIDKMVVDYSINCSELPGALILANKEFCQYGIIYKKDGTYEYLRGFCDYDLMNLSQPFDSIGFSMENPIEVIYPSDKVEITFSTRDRVPYFIESKSHKEVNLNCNKML